MGRPRTEAPRGRLTIQEAAELSGLSYQRVYVLVASGQIPAIRDESGVYTIAQRDAKLIQRREPADTDRKAVMLRVPLERYETWKLAAGDQPVSTWLGQLADQAANRRR